MAASSSSTKSSPSEKPLDAAAAAAAAARSVDDPNKESLSEDDAAAPPEDAVTTAASETDASVVVVPPQTTTEDAPPPAQLKRGDDDDDTPSVALPTYESVETSQRYAVAKTLLNNGDFEDALTTIAEGLEEVKEQLANSQVLDSEMIDFHPSLAPFHYLYGTTLLYSVEESTTDPMMMQQQPSEGGDESAEDTEIAHENLDVARVIVEQYLNSSERRHDAGSVRGLRLDLAQIRLREGDLHRLNGRYDEALQDYQACLELRTGNLGPYDRKLADVHYNLGLTLALRVADAGTNGSAEDETATATTVAAAAAAPASAPHPPTSMTPQQLEGARRQSAHHYLQCGRILAGQLALLARRDADAFLRRVEAALPAVKTTGDEDATMPDAPARARLHLRTLRRHVAEHLPSPESVNAPEMASLLDVLQEIQETMDEAEASEAGVQQVAHMRAAISAAVTAAAGGDGAAVAEADDPSGDNDTAAAAFGSESAAALTAAAQPVMAVRKKKRPPPSAAADEPKDAKQPKPTSE